MATIFEIQLHGFVRNVLIHHLLKYGEHATYSFWVTFVTVFSQKDIVSLPWQPDQNNTYFWKAVT